jgi:nitroreductase
MELQEVVIKRRTIRDFSDKPIDQEIINTALHAGMHAPSYNHLKQWDFILVKDLKTRLALTQTEEMIEEVTEELRQAFEGQEIIVKEMYLDAIPKQKRMILTAPELLVIVYKPKTQINDSKRVYDLNCLASVWCCIENILLSLAEKDVFGVTFIPQNTLAVKKILTIPQELEVAAIMPFGYKAHDAKIPRQKEISLEEKIHINNW